MANHKSRLIGCMRNTVCIDKAENARKAAKKIGIRRPFGGERNKSNLLELYCLEPTYSGKEAPRRKGPLLQY